MGLLSDNFLINRITSLTINSNYNILDQFKNSIDNFVLNNVNRISLLPFQNVQENSEILYFFSNPVEGNTTGIWKLSEYIDNIRLANPLINSITIYFKKSELLVSTLGVRFLSENYNPGSELINYINHYTSISKDSTWTYSQQDASTQDPILMSKNSIVFARRLPLIGKYDEGGFILVTITEDVLFKVIKNYCPIDFGNIMIFDEDGILISHSDKQYLYSNVNNLEYGNRILESKENKGYFFATIDGVNSIISYATSDYNNWKYVSIKPVENIRKSYRFISYFLLLLATITFVVAIIASYISTRKVCFPLKKLTNSCKEIIYTSSPQVPKNECEIISSTLNMLSDKVMQQEKRIVENFPILKHHFIMTLIGNECPSFMDIRNKMDLLKISFPYTGFYTVIFKFKTIPDTLDLTALELAKLDIIDKIELTSADNRLKCLCTESNSQLISIFNLDNPDSALETTISSIHQYIYDTYAISVCAGIGCMSGSPGMLQPSYITAAAGIKYSYIYPDKKIFFPDEVELYEQNSSTGSDQHLIDNFSDALKAQSMKASLICLGDIFHAIRHGNFSYNRAMKLISKILFFLEGHIEQLKLDTRPVIEGDIFIHFNRISDIYELENWMKSIVNHIFIFISSRHAQHNSEIVEKVKEFIKENDNTFALTLISIADAIYISPNHLSRIFKENTGLNFVDYLSDFRLTRAKEMLESSSLKVKDISVKVGYSNAQYLIKKFKQKFNMTPAEYRQKLLSDCKYNTNQSNSKEICRL